MPFNKEVDSQAELLTWLCEALPTSYRVLLDTGELDAPVLELPLAQLRLAHALYAESSEQPCVGSTMGHLSERLGVKQNALTQVADRLVSNNLAERMRDPSDRRVVRLRLTDKGLAWVRQRRDRRSARLASVLNLLSSNELDEFVCAAQILERVAKQARELISNGGGEVSDDAAPDAMRPAIGITVNLQEE